MIVDIIEFVAVIIFGIIMTVSPRTFLGRAKFDKDAMKAEKFISLTGKAIIAITSILLIILIIRNI